MSLLQISFESIRLYTGSYNEFSDFIFNKIRKDLNNKIIIVHINLRNFYFLNKDVKLKEEINKNCISVLEGIGMKIGFWLKRYHFLQDLNGTDLFPLLMKQISKTNLGVFLLGSKKKLSKKLQVILLVIIQT